jgi:hypothetical protein
VSTPAKIVKRVLPPQWIARIRKLGRLRWYAKYKNVRAGGVDVRRQPARIVRHVLLDPEVDNYTYELENADELAPFLARALGVPEAEAARVLDEAATDEELDRELARRVRWRFDTKWRIHLGRRVLWYALVRLRRPSLVVEAGVQEGLGSLVLLRALERNTAEGAPGRLLSIDPLANAGWLVPRRLRAGWTFVNARSEEGLARALDGLEVDVLLSDSGGSYERELGEYEAALAHGSRSLVLIAGSGDQTSALPDFCARHGFAYSYLQDRPKRHFFRGSGTGIAVRSEGESADPEPARETP